MIVSQDQNKGVIIDNDTCDGATVIQVESSEHGIIFEAIRLFTNLGINITKAYVSCEEGWFMDVFHVTNKYGQKVEDEVLLDHIVKALTVELCFFTSTNEAVEVIKHQGCTMILLRGVDKLGLLSELSKILTDHGSYIVNADLWTHWHHASAVIQIAEKLTGCQINDSRKVSKIRKDVLRLLKSSAKLRSQAPQVMQKDGRVENVTKVDQTDSQTSNVDGRTSKATVTLSNCKERNYTHLEIKSNDRPRLLIDTIGALMVRQYVVFHATVTTGKTGTYQEYYIRHTDGRPISTKKERDHLQKVLEETITSPDAEGVELELHAEGLVLVSDDILSLLREEGCWIKRARITKTDETSKHTFLITDASGKAVNQRTLQLIQQRIGENMLQVKRKSGCSPLMLQRNAKGFLFGNLLKHLSSQFYKFFTSNHFTRRTSPC